MYQYQGCLKFLGRCVRIHCQNHVCQMGWRRVSFMSAMYSIYFPVMGWMTALAWCCWDQWLSPRAMAMCAVSMPQKSGWDKLRGESIRDRVGTLGGDGHSVLGVTTLRGNDAAVISCVWVVVYDLVFRDRGIGEANSRLDDSARHGRWMTFRGAVGSVATKVCCNLSLKIAANSASAQTVSSLICMNLTSGWGFCKASVMCFAAMSNRPVDNSCGIWKVCEKNSRVSMMRSLAVEEMYTFWHQ
jgi:hypothetical protein